MPKKALLIGCNYIAVPNLSLRGCIDDVLNMENMLLNKYKYLKNEIVILRDDLQIEYGLPTKQNIINNLTSIVNQSGLFDEIWIHYSGHGSQIDVNNSIESVIIPVDYYIHGPILEDELFAIIKNIKCPAILLFDCCHSGNICDMPWRFEVNSTGNISVSKSSVNVINPNIYIFSGCKESQKCLDEYDKEILDYVGAFTVSFLKCLYSNKKDIPIYLFFKNICDYMKRKGFQQQPVLTTSSNYLNRIITKTMQDKKTNVIFRNFTVGNMKSILQL
jgi:hypothetical protein